MAEEEKVPVEGTEEAPMQISRRDFLVGAGAGVIVTGAAAAGYAALRGPQIQEVIHEIEVPVEREVVREVTVPGAEVLVGPQMPASLRAVALNIDGKTHNLVVDVRESLWEVMTKSLGLHSSNLGCDRAQCGACAVVVDGRAVNGCTVLAARLGRGQEIITVDTLGPAGTPLVNLHPVQRAYVEEGGHQCAICTRGFVMSTYALLTQNLNPTEQDVREALAGNICRCGNYPKIFDSVFKAAEMMRAQA